MRTACRLAPKITSGEDEMAPAGVEGHVERRITLAHDSGDIVRAGGQRIQVKRPFCQRVTLGQGDKLIRFRAYGVGAEQRALRRR